MESPPPPFALTGQFHCVRHSRIINNIATLYESQGGPFQMLKISASERLSPPLAVLHLCERGAAYVFSASLDFPVFLPFPDGRGDMLNPAVFASLYHERTDRHSRRWFLALLRILVRKIPTFPPKLHRIGDPR